MATGAFPARATVTATGTVGSWDPSAPVDERIEALHQQITKVDGRLDGVLHELRQEVADRKRVVAELQQNLGAQNAELRGLLEEDKRRSALTDARGLPVVAFGILLSGVPDELASIPYGVGWLLPALGIFFSVVAVVPAWRVEASVGR